MYKWIYYFCLDGINNPPFAYNMVYKNNPLNIRYSHLNRWRGQIEPKNGFCQFENLDYGIRAAYVLLFRTYRRKGLRTIKDIVSRFAPSSENDTERYINFIVRSFRFYFGDNTITPDLRIYLWQYMVYLVVSMAKIESNTKLSYDYVSTVFYNCLYNKI